MLHRAKSKFYYMIDINTFTPGSRRIHVLQKFTHTFIRERDAHGMKWNTHFRKHRTLYY